MNIGYKSRQESKAKAEELRKAKEIVNNYLKQNIVSVLLNDAFPLQREFIQDTNRLKALLASRRFGKSTSACLYLLITALSEPLNACIYVALVRDSAKLIMNQIFIPLLDKYKIKYTVNHTDLIYTFPNGSWIRFLGANNSVKETAKLRGGKYTLCVVDECQDFTTADLRSFVYDVLKPACIDKQGTVVMCGTPSDIVETGDMPLFYAVTTHQERAYAWKVFEGNTRENPHMRENFEKEIQELSAHDPFFLNSPTYFREYCGRWVINSDNTIYKFDDLKNTIEELPPDDYTYIMGLDFGFNDATAFVVAAYSKYDPTLYIVKTFKKTKMTIDDVEIKLKEFKAQYKINRIICDHAKQTVETLRKRLHYNFITAEKADKFGNIGVMNNDLYAGRIKLLPGCDELKREWNSLIYDKTADKPTELASCENHCADSALYMFRDAKHYLFNHRLIKVDPQSEDFMKQEIMAKIMRKIQNEQNLPQLTQAEIDFSND